MNSWSVGAPAIVVVVALGGAAASEPTSKPSIDVMVKDYCQAWSEPDPMKRQRLLESVWAENGTYTDPTAHVEGRKRLVEHIGKLHQELPKVRFELTSGVDAHHDRLRFTWRMVLADGKVAAEGTDFGTLNADGKIRSIVGFFGPLAPPK